jgi:hypothetical protein
VQADEEHPVVLIKGFLGAVSVVLQQQQQEERQEMCMSFKLLH